MGPLIRDWVGAFLIRHMDRFDPHDWPDPENETKWDLYERLWVVAFEHHKIMEHEAERASERLAETPPRYRKDHIPAVVKSILATRDAAHRAAAQTSLAKEVAEAKARRETRLRETREYEEKLAALTQFWEALDPDERALCEKKIWDEHPGLRTFPVFLRHMAYGLIEPFLPPPEGLSAWPSKWPNLD